ncbi:MAG: hypothetical protein H7Y08_02685, partial [Rhizobiaceae bacterium]|nr:hypothetical protein [Rhizobiaceae bacterium]
MRILPFPSVTFGDVVVSGEGGGAPLMTVAGFRMDAELAPYMSGEIRIFSMRLDRPQIRLAIGADGTVAIPAGDPGLPARATVVLENVVITEGSLTVENGRTGRTHIVSGISARLSAQSLTGPFSGSASLTAGGETVALVLSSGPFQPEAGLPLKLTVQAPSLDASVVFDGLAAVSEGAPRFGGEILVASPLPAPTVTLPASAPAAADASNRTVAVADPIVARPVLPPFKLAGTVLATPSGIALSGARVAVGASENPYVLTGSGSIGLSRLAHFALDLEGQQIDVDEIVAQEAGNARPAANDGAPETAAPPPVTFDQRLQAVEAVLAAVPRPGLPGTVAIQLPVVVAGDTTIRDVGFTVSPTDTGWSVERFVAELPGRTRMEASGVVGLDEELSFKGDLLVAARQPSGFAGWLVGTVDPAIRTLSQAGFSAAVDLTRARQVFESLEVDVGGEVLTGRLERSGPRGARAMTAFLNAGAVDLDALLALSALFTGDGDSIADADRLSLKIGAGPVRYREASARRIDADLSYDGARLSIARLDLADLAGADLTVSGDLAGLGTDLSGRLAIGLDAARPSEAIAFLESVLPPSPAIAALAARGSSLGPLRITGEVETVEEVSGEKPTLQARVSGTAAGTDVSATLALGNGIYAPGAAGVPEASGRFGLQATVSNDVPAVLLGQLGIEAVPVDVPSPLSLELSLSAGPTGPVVASAAMRAPDTELAGEGSFEIAPEGIFGAEFGLSAKSADIGPWLTATGRALGQSAAAALPLDLAGTIRYADGDLSLDGLAGKIGDADVAADLSRHGAGPVSGTLFVSDLSLPWLATLVYGRSPTAEDGSASLASAEFLAPLLPPVDLALDVTADRLSLGGALAIAPFSGDVGSTATELSMREIKGGIGGGTVSGSGSLRNANGVGGVSLDASFSDLDLATLTLLAEQGDVADLAETANVAGTMNLSLALGGSGQSYAALATALTGAGRVKLADASFAGLRPRLLRPILDAADVDGFVPGTETVARVLSDLTRASRYPLPALASELSVAAGVASVSPLRLPGAGETLTVEGGLDLRTLEVEAALRLDLEAGDDAVEGAEPAVLYSVRGPIAGPRLLADVQPLASYLSVRAFEREEARVEAMQEQLQERLRLRREARYTRWRERERVAAVEAERLRVE